MSHIRRKIKYTEEGTYGSEETHYIYMDQNNSCDVCTIYDDKFNVLLSFGDTTTKPLSTALINLWTKDLEDCPEMEYWDGNLETK